MSASNEFCLPPQRDPRFQKQDEATNTERNSVTFPFVGQETVCSQLTEASTGRPVGATLRKSLVTTRAEQGHQGTPGRGPATLTENSVAAEPCPAVKQVWAGTYNTLLTREEGRLLAARPRGREKI